MPKYNWPSARCKDGRHRKLNKWPEDDLKQLARMRLHSKGMSPIHPMRQAVHLMTYNEVISLVLMLARLPLKEVMKRYGFYHED